MGDLKPLGSEKLSGDEKLKRILQLTYYNQNKNNNKTTKPELVKESTAGGVYGIVKEKDGYYVKRGLNEQSLDYIGGLFMKNKNKFSSYAEALKRLQLLKGQEELNEATKYVLKQNKPTDTTLPEPEVSASAPDAGSAELPPSPMDTAEPSSTPTDMPPSDVPSPAGEVEPETGESKRSDYMAEIQKYAGKLGQELRDQKEKMEGDDVKYVLNMVISALDLDKLELEDLEEIGKNFERDEEEGEEPTSEPSAEPTPEPSAEPTPEPVAETDLNEEDPMSALDEFINTKIDANESVPLDKMSDLDEKDDVMELDLDEIKNQINQSVSEILRKHLPK